MAALGEENPFAFEEAELPLPAALLPFGKCVDCGADGFFKMRGSLLCFPCGYNRAN